MQWLPDWDGTTGVIGQWTHLMAGPGLNGIAYVGGVDVLQEGLRVPYEIAAKAERATVTEIAIPTGPWRAVMAGTNAFANECFFDEVAVAMGADPYQLRLDHLPASSPVRGVLELAATGAGWGTPLDAGRGRGIACHVYHTHPLRWSPT